MRPASGRTVNREEALYSFRGSMMPLLCSGLSGDGNGRIVAAVCSWRRGRFLHFPTQQPPIGSPTEKKSRLKPGLRTRPARGVTVNTTEHPRRRFLSLRNCYNRRWRVWRGSGSEKRSTLKRGLQRKSPDFGVLDKLTPPAVLQIPQGVDLPGHFQTTSVDGVVRPLDVDRPAETPSCTAHGRPTAGRAESSGVGKPIQRAALSRIAGRRFPVHFAGTECGSLPSPCFPGLYNSWVPCSGCGTLRWQSTGPVRRSGTSQGRVAGPFLERIVR